MPGRSFSAANQYRYGFNGKENDKDISEGGQDYGMRIYDTRLGRFLSVDPLMNSYPYYSPYQFSGNMPIWMIDLDGAEPNPSKFLYDALKVDMSLAPASFTAKSGKTFYTQIKDGRNYNPAWAWEQIRSKNVIKWSKSNAWRIDNGISPKSDKLLRSQFKEFAPFKNQTMHIHHLDHGPSTSYGLPQELHTGKGYTSMWHKFGRALVLGLALFDTYSQATGDPLLLNAFTIPNELEFIDYATQIGLKENDYTRAIIFAGQNNSRTNKLLPSAGKVGIYYASAEEMLGTQFPDLSKAKMGSFIVAGGGGYYPDAKTASGVLTKTVTHAIIYFKANGSKDGFLPVHAIQIAPMPQQRLNLNSHK